jgi:hypothetical protein
MTDQYDAGNEILAQDRAARHEGDVHLAEEAGLGLLVLWLARRYRARHPAVRGMLLLERIVRDAVLVVGGVIVAFAARMIMPQRSVRTAAPSGTPRRQVSPAPVTKPARQGAFAVAAQQPLAAISRQRPLDSPQIELYGTQCYLGNIRLTLVLPRPHDASRTALLRRLSVTAAAPARRGR